LTKLRWIVQENLYNEQGYARFIEALIRLECDYMVVKVVPFVNKVLPEGFDSWSDDYESAIDPITDDSYPMFVCGATTLTNITLERGWVPGSFINDNLHYSKWKENWGDNLLNPDSKVGVAGDFLDIPRGDYFVRPTEDTKSFSGTVFTGDQFKQWAIGISDVVETEYSPLHHNTEIVVSSMKTIYNECRLFIVDGEVVTASMYKAGNRVQGNPDVDQRYLDFAKEMTDIWAPAEGFVMDVADTPNGLKIIEVNNLNSAGFYACDTYKIVNAIEEWWERKCSKMNNNDELINFVEELRAVLPCYQTRETETYRRLAIINGLNCTKNDTIIISKNSLFKKAANTVLETELVNNLDTIIYSDVVDDDEVVIGTPNDAEARIVKITTDYEPW